MLKSEPGASAPDTDLLFYPFIVQGEGGAPARIGGAAVGYLSTLAHQHRVDPHHRAALLLMMAAPDTPLAFVVAGIAVVGGGHGTTMALVVDLIIASAPPEKTGSVAAAQQISGELGTALGIALSGAVGMAIYRISLAAAMPPEIPEPAADTALSSIHGGVTTAESLTSAGPGLLDAVHRALTTGLQAYTGLSLTLLIVAGVLITAFLVAEGRPRPDEDR